MRLLLPALLCLVLSASVSAPCDGQVEERHQNCGALSQPGHSPDYEPLPRYSIERREHYAGKRPTLLLRISMPTEAFNGTGVARLACKLSIDFPKEDAIEALIFDDKKAARSLSPFWTADQPHYGTYLWHLKGHYILDREKKQEFVEFLIPVVQDNLLGVKRYRIW